MPDLTVTERVTWDETAPKPGPDCQGSDATTDPTRSIASA